MHREDFEDAVGERAVRVRCWWSVRQAHVLLVQDQQDADDRIVIGVFCVVRKLLDQLEEVQDEAVVDHHHVFPRELLDPCHFEQELQKHAVQATSIVSAVADQGHKSCESTLVLHHLECRLVSPAVE